MLSIPLKPLHTCTATLGILAGITSAQAGLTITFEESGDYLNIIFSGQATAPFSVQDAQTNSYTSFLTGFIYMLNEVEASFSDQKYYGFEDGWTYANRLPLTGLYENPVHFSGAGGFTFIPSANNRFSVVSVESADKGDQIVWNGVLTYNGNLAGIGLARGNSGTLLFSKDSETLSVNWTAIPEPGTYALILGAGICAVALLRRRS